MEKGESVRDIIFGSKFYFHGVNIHNLYYSGGSEYDSHSSKKEEVVEKSIQSDEKIARDIEANWGDGEPLDSKRKWAAEEEEQQQETTGLSPARLSKLDDHGTVL